METQWLTAEPPTAFVDFSDLLGADPSPLDRELLVTTFADGQARSRSEETFTLRELAGEIHVPSASAKGLLPWLKLARFGDTRTDKGSLRHNANMLEITGIEGDYDGEAITVDQAAAMLRSAGIAALIYTSPSHTPERPRYRVLCPLSRAMPAADRERLCARLNGALSGTLSGESFNRSQAYFYGCVRGSPEPETAIVDGRAIDVASDLDAVAIGRDGKPYAPQPTLVAAVPVDADDADDDDWTYQPRPDDDRIDAALKAIPVADADNAETGGRDMWLRIGQALHQAYGGSEDGFKRWDAWSSGGAKYDARSVRSSWKSFGRSTGKRVGIGSLFDIAKRYRWGVATDPFDLIGNAPAAAAAAAKATLPLLDPATWQGVPIPEREWALKEWIPAGQATYLTGPGSAGKSLLAQQLATCIALGRPFLGIETKEARALYLTCEDDALELQRRQVAICMALDTPLAALSGKLFLASLTGEIDTALCTFSDKGELQPTPRYGSVESGAASAGITFIALDNVAHLFAGNENARHDVASFVSLLNRLAMRIGGTVLFIGHPNKAGDSFSGSTAWENQVRSRLYMETPDDTEGNPSDRDTRVLSRQKANYARNGEQVRFRWHEWAFARDAELPDAVSQASRARIEDQGFMACLDKTAKENRAVSPNPSASNYAPRIFARMPTAAAVNIAGFERALQRLLDQGVVMNGRSVYQRANRSWVTGLGRAPTLHEPSAPTVHEPCTNPSTNPHEPAEISHAQTLAHRLHQPCTNPSTNPAPTRTLRTPLYYVEGKGAAHEPLPPPYQNGEANAFDDESDGAIGGSSPLGADRGERRAAEYQPLIESDEGFHGHD